MPSIVHIQYNTYYVRTYYVYTCSKVQYVIVEYYVLCITYYEHTVYH